jgi:hypothetical protein
MDQNIVIYLLFSILLVYIIFEMSNNIIKYNVGCNCNNKEQFLNLNSNIDSNSPEYSHTVNLPINDPVSCSNFCGPTGKCLKTGEQCLSDVDCKGCRPHFQTSPNTIYNINALSSEASGKLTGSQGLNYSNLTSGYNGHLNDFEEAYPGSYNTEIGNPYRGVDTWEKSFNKGLELYNKRQENIPPLNSFEKTIKPIYPTRLSITGLFYETVPLPGNIPTNM